MHHWLLFNGCFSQEKAKKKTYKKTGNQVFKKIALVVTLYISKFVFWSQHHILFVHFSFSYYKVGTIKCEEAGESLREDKSDDKPCTTKRRQSKNQCKYWNLVAHWEFLNEFLSDLRVISILHWLLAAIVSPSSSKQVQEKDKAENKK